MDGSPGSMPPGSMPPGSMPPGSYNSSTYSLYASAVPVTVCCTIAVVLRFLSRHLARTKLWWDDWLIILALICFYGLAATELLTINYGLGHHVWTLDLGIVLAPFLKALLAYEILYYATQSLVKFSLILLYFRLFKPSRTFRLACYAVAASTTIWFLTCFFATVFTCVPLHDFWSPNPADHDHCISAAGFVYFVGISNLALDLTILCLPFPIILSLQMKRRDKITIGAMFLLGFFVCGVSVIRIISIRNLTKLTDPTWVAVDVYIWSTVEPSCSIIGACLPTLRPLFPKTFRRATVSSAQTNGGTKSLRNTSKRLTDSDSQAHDEEMSFSGGSGSKPGSDEENLPIHADPVYYGKGPQGVITRVSSTGANGSERAKGLSDMQGIEESIGMQDLSNPNAHTRGDERTGIFVRRSIVQE